MNRRVPRTCVRSWIGFACTHETRRPSPNTWLKAPMRKLMAFLPKCNVFSFLPSVNFHEYENYLDFSCRYIPAFRFYPWLCSSNYSFDLDKTDSLFFLRHFVSIVNRSHYKKCLFSNQQKFIPDDQRDSYQILFPF